MYILLYILTAGRIATKVMLRGVKLADCPISCASCSFGARLILKSLDFLGSVPNRDHIGANLSVSRHIFLGRWVGGLSLIRQIFAVMIGDQGEVDASIHYTGGSDECRSTQGEMDTVQR